MPDSPNLIGLNEATTSLKRAGIAHLPLLPPRATFAWLLWLAVLLPVAQFTAVWHGYSHSAALEAPPGEERQAPHVVHCDLCLTAAGLGGNVPHSGGPGVQGAMTSVAPAAVHVASVWAAPTRLAYLSRAPPLTPR